VICYMFTFFSFESKKHLNNSITVFESIETFDIDILPEACTYELTRSKKRASLSVRSSKLLAEGKQRFRNVKRTGNAKSHIRRLRNTDLSVHDPRVSNVCKQRFAVSLRLRLSRCAVFRLTRVLSPMSRSRANVICMRGENKGRQVSHVRDISIHCTHQRVSLRSGVDHAKYT